ncbi:MAG: 2-oxoacid:acceptor oxidoreductase subunit alpha [Candidatus Bipolaricaulia bacterium]
MSDQVKTQEAAEKKTGKGIALDDVNLMTAGQGGDGTITVVTLFAEIFRSMGLNVYTSRNVLSRIKGGHASGVVRANPEVRYAIGDLQVLVAFDEEAVITARDDFDPEGVVIYDSSAGELNPERVPPEVKIYNAPFSKLSMRHLRRDLFKNTIAFAVAGRLLSISDDVMKEVLQTRFARKGSLVLDYNLNALEVGLEVADDLGLEAGLGHYRIKQAPLQERLLLTGNEALAFGFLVAGGRFFSGYPITPSTEIMEWLAKWLPQFGGVVKQTEDELSGVNMAIGAALAGARAMVASSGPGLSLIQEGIGQSGAAEIPLVIVDSQRAGPSTGMPTKVEQSDLQLMVFGGHGEFPRIVLTPGHPCDCFYLTIRACNLAEKYQLPVFIAMDQALSQNLATVEVDAFDLENVEIDRGKRLTPEALEKISVYRRYALTPDGVSPYTVPSTADGMSLVTGNEHNEFGQVVTDRANRKRMMDKRMRKLEVAKEDLPQPKLWGEPEARIGFIGIGCAFGPIREAMELLKTDGVQTKYFQPLSIWPPQQDEIDAFLEDCDRVYVVEHNYSGQLANLIKLSSRHDPSAKITSILKYDGAMFKPYQIAQRVLETIEEEEEG